MANITRSFAWKHKPGGDILRVSLRDTTAAPTPLLDNRLGPGYVWGFDLAQPSRRLVFSFASLPQWPPSAATDRVVDEGQHAWRLRQEIPPLQLYAISLDTPGAVQRLTDDPYWSDFEPTCLSDGRIVFASDRCGKAPECGNVTYDFANPNLYICDADGSHVRRLTDNRDIDRYPQALDDGRIVYTHWEYQERHFMEVHALWTVHPDGTMADALFKQHLPAPLALRSARSIPDSAKLVCVATGHHTQAYGPVVRIDPNQGVNRTEGIEIVTPGVHPQEGPMAGTPVPGGGVRDAGGFYQQPLALDEEQFLVSYAYRRPNCSALSGVDSNGFGLYLIDTRGNKELIYRSAIFSTATALPLQTAAKPTFTIASSAPDRAVHEEPDSSTAVCYLQDVYRGMEQVPRGTVRFLRIAQHVPWPYIPEIGQVNYIKEVAGAKHAEFTTWSPVRVIGIVPVEKDGSALFTVPSGQAIYFQTLDADYLEVRRMRSMTSFAAGTVRGCTGCHESRSATPSHLHALSLALQRPPRTPEPPAWEADQLIDFETLVQPILDRHCTECHRPGAEDTRLDLTVRRGSDDVLMSYRQLLGFSELAKTPDQKRWVVTADRFSNSSVSQPAEFGSRVSPLIQLLKDDPLHRDRARLGADQWLTLVTWIDANAPYYGRFIPKIRTQLEPL